MEHLSTSSGNLLHLNGLLTALLDGRMHRIGLPCWLHAGALCAPWKAGVFSLEDFELNFNKDSCFGHYPYCVCLLLGPGENLSITDLSDQDGPSRLICCVPHTGGSGEAAGVSCQAPLVHMDVAPDPLHQRDGPAYAKTG